LSPVNSMAGKLLLGTLHCMDAFLRQDVGRLQYPYHHELCLE
jgi:hypothetical protein